MTIPALSDADARALAVAVAREVMGWPVTESNDDRPPTPFLEASGGRLWLFRHSTFGQDWNPLWDGNQALEVLCKARGEECWTVTCLPSGEHVCTIGTVATGRSAFGATFGEAVCRAALARVRGE